MGILTQRQSRPNHRWLNHAAGFVLRTLDGLLPQDCLLCGEPGAGDVLCRACREELPRLPAAVCPRCALPTPAGETCGRCLSHPPRYDRAFAVFDYGFPVDRVIQAFKYAHRLALAPYFGRCLAERIGRADDVDADVIVPMPLHPQRLKERGFNQALELARPVAKTLGVPVDMNICRRIRHTPAQAGLPWRERARNIRGAFHCTGDLSGARVMLIDDVMTTGASLDECARTLKLHGAEQVILLVVARALL